MKYTPVRIDQYINYLDKYNLSLQRYDSISKMYMDNMYDFETEHALVEKCEAGEMLSINDLTPREHE